MTEQRRIATTANLLVGLLFSACAAIPRSQPDIGTTTSLTGTRWSLQTLNGEPVVAGPTATLEFGPDAHIIGNDGCNQFMGTYRADGASIRLEQNRPGTLRACSESIEAQARGFHAALQHASHFGVEEGGLRLLDDAGVDVAAFIPAGTSPVGATWEVVGYNNGRQAVVSPIIGSRITATIGNDGRITGNAGCNRYFANYRLEGTTIEIASPGVARKTCAEPQGVMQQEVAYLEALTSSVTIRLEGDSLDLRNSSGSLAVRFERLVDSKPR